MMREIGDYPKQSSNELGGDDMEAGYGDSQQQTKSFEAAVRG